MRIATFNVNSARTRADRMVDFLTRHDVDVLAVQETKCRDDQFPRLPFEQAGYEVAHVGYGQWNGVALISRIGLEDVSDHFPAQPGFAKKVDDEQAVEARAVGATCGGVRVWSLYVPNGREIADRHYEYKLRWLDALSAHVRGVLADDPAAKLLCTGDFNIAPTDADVWDRRFFDGKTHVTEPERAFFQQLTESGLVETTRRFTPGEYTYWDYKAMRFGRDEGMRIDFHLASTALAETARAGFIDREERAGDGASDHAPVVVDYSVDGD